MSFSSCDRKWLLKATSAALFNFVFLAYQNIAHATSGTALAPIVNVDQIEFKGTSYEDPEGNLKFYYNFVVAEEGVFAPIFQFLASPRLVPIENGRAYLNGFSDVSVSSKLVRGVRMNSVFLGSDSQMWSVFEGLGIDMVVRSMEENGAAVVVSGPDPKGNSLKSVRLNSDMYCEVYSNFGVVRMARCFLDIPWTDAFLGVESDGLVSSDILMPRTQKKVRTQALTVLPDFHLSAIGSSLKSQSLYVENKRTYVFNMSGVENDISYGVFMSSPQSDSFGGEFFRAKTTLNLSGSAAAKFILELRGKPDVIESILNITDGTKQLILSANPYRVGILTNGAGSCSQIIGQEESTSNCFLEIFLD